MFNPSLRCILGLAVALACASPAAAQGAPDPLTRFLDGVFKGNSGRAPAPAAQPAPAVQAPEPAQAPATKPPRAQAAPQAKAATPAKPKAVTQKPAPQRQVAKPQPQAKPVESEVTQTKPAASEPEKPAVKPTVQTAEEPKQEPAPVEAKPARVAEPPKPAKATPTQAAPISTPVAAAPVPVTPTSPPVPTPAAALDQVNAYFNGIDQMSAYFVQKNPDGQRAEGTLSMQRPGRLHFAYSPPSTLEVVSDGRNVAIRDKKLGTNDVYPVGQTPLKFLVQDHIDLARDTKVRDVQVARDGMVTVRFDDSATLGGTSKITLRFDSRAKALRQWTIVDAQGYETSVTLSGLNVVPRAGARAAN